MASTKFKMLIAKVEGAGSRLSALTKDYRQLEDALRSLHQQFEQGKLTQPSMLQSQSCLTSAIRLVSTTKALDAARQGIGDYRQNLMGLSYAMNDFFSVSGNMQQRLNAIANNMPMLLAGFGGWGLALSAILPIVGALTGPLKELYDTLANSKSIDESTLAIEKLSKRIAEISKQPIKLAVDQLELDAAKAKMDALNEGKKEFEKKNEKTDFEKESGEQVQTILDREAGGSEAVKNRLASQHADEAKANDPAYQALVKETKRLQAEIEDTIAHPEKYQSAPDEFGRTTDISGMVRRGAQENLETNRNKRLERSNAIRANSEAQVGSIVAKAKAGDQDAQAELARRAGGDVAAGLGANSAAALRGANEADAAQDRGDAAARRGFEARTTRRADQLQTEAGQKRNLQDIKAQDDAALAKVTDKIADKLQEIADRAKSGAIGRGEATSSIRFAIEEEAKRQGMAGQDLNLLGQTAADRLLGKKPPMANFPVDPNLAATGVRGRVARGREELQRRATQKANAAQAQRAAAQAKKDAAGSAKANRAAEAKLNPAEIRQRRAAQADLARRAAAKRAGAEDDAKTIGGAQGAGAVDKAAGLGDKAVEAATAYLAQQKAANEAMQARLQWIAQNFGEAAAQQAAMNMRMQQANAFNGLLGAAPGTG